LIRGLIEPALKVKQYWINQNRSVEKLFGLGREADYSWAMNVLLGTPFFRRTFLLLGNHSCRSAEKPATAREFSWIGDQRSGVAAQRREKRIDRRHLGPRTFKRQGNLPKQIVAFLFTHDGRMTDGVEEVHSR
jgi:hypothetical protein